MQKVKANALWNSLTPEQQKALDKWLFDENLSYAAILPRAQSELGYKGQVSSLKRYFARRTKEREAVNFEKWRDQAVAVSSAPGDAKTFRQASMKVVGQYFFERVRSAPENIKEWAPAADLLVRNDYNELIREAKAREHKIREDAMAFAKEKFEFDMTEQALKALPRL